MTEQKSKKKSPTPRMFYGVNAAAALTEIEIRLRIEIIGERRLVKQEMTRGEIQQTFIHYLKFIRSISEADLGG